MSKSMERRIQVIPDDADSAAVVKMIGRMVNENDQLRAENAAMRDAITEFRSWCCGIGGPLNDNLLQFNADQRKWLSTRMNALLSVAIDIEEDERDV